jgi:hypothetical protein
LRAFPKPENASLALIQGKWGIEKKNVNFLFNIPIFPESGPGKHFHASEMRTIDFSHDFPLYRLVWQKNFLRLVSNSYPDFVRKWNYGSIVRRHFLKGLGFCSKQLF